jgi:flavin-dependent dehydrogenase
MSRNAGTSAGSKDWSEILLKETPAPSGAEDSTLALEDGSRVAVLGAGPSGTFFTFFLLRMARRVGLDLEVDVYERKDFTQRGPQGCNHCGGIVSESLVQVLATEGINLPPDVVQRGIESYVLHTDVGTVRIETPHHEKRIAAMYRGAGPRGDHEIHWGSFDKYLGQLAQNSGARLVNEQVESVRRQDGRIEVTTKQQSQQTYDLLVGATGVNAPTVKLYEELGISYDAPDTTKTYISEYYLGRDVVKEQFGDAMHVFLMNIPRLKFAALIPKGEHVTLVLLGKEIGRELVQAFLTAPEVEECFPDGFDITGGAVCMCSPKINVRGSSRPFADRIVLLGDSAVTRLYKDGIGAAYMTAKAAATTAVLQGISEEAFGRHYQPACKSISTDNAIGKAIFIFTELIQKWNFTKRGILRMVRGEQDDPAGDQPMSGVLWDTFTGSATYRDILRRTVKPRFIAGLTANIAASVLPPRSEKTGARDEAGTG